MLLGAAMLDANYSQGTSPVCCDYAITKRNINFLFICEL